MSLFKVKDKGSNWFSRLALQLHYDLPKGTGCRCVLVVTPTDGDAAAFAATHLASSMGQELSLKVLLVDACSSNPQLSESLSCTNMPGWADLLNAPSMEMQHLILASSSENVKFLPAGDDGNVLPPSEELRARLNAAHEQYDFVILFGGAIDRDYKALALLPYTGATLLLVEESETPADDLAAARETLASFNAQNVRMVLTSRQRKKKKTWLPERRSPSSSAQTIASRWLPERDA
jgi:Mrp family chromosome partitioning ATPase